MILDKGSREERDESQTEQVPAPSRVPCNLEEGDRDRIRGNVLGGSGVCGLGSDLRIHQIRRISGVQPYGRIEATVIATIVHL